MLADSFMILLLVIGYTVTGGDALLFPLAGAAVSALLLLGMPAIWALQPQTGRLGQAGLWCLGIGAGIALVVRVLSLGSQVEVGDLVPLLSAVFNLLGSVVVGWMTIRARVFPVAVGWLLIVGGVLNLLGGLPPAGLFTTLVGIVSGLAVALANAGYGWTIVGSTRHHSPAG